MESFPFKNPGITWVPLKTLVILDYIIMYTFFDFLDFHDCFKSNIVYAENY